MANELSTRGATRWATRVASALCATTLWGLAGCASEVTPTPSPGADTTTEAVASETSALSHSRGKDKDGDGDPGDQCSPLACCFPTVGGGWQSDPLEDRLQQLGCTTPSPYQQTQTAFWSWTECPFDLALVATVFKYSATPYSAHFVENACLPFHLGKAIVVFDPTCPTCGEQVGTGAGGVFFQ